jgi:phosphohistidine phosphatase
MIAGWRVFLVRHGEATSTTDNSERPLTITGRQHAECVASWLDECGHEVEEILHSEKLRARQTAKIFGNRLGVHAARVHQSAGLKPHDDPSSVAQTLEVDRRSVMLVGHLPFLNRLASTLLVGEPDRLNTRFTEAGVVVLRKVSGGWQIEAVASHEML